MFFTQNQGYGGLFAMTKRQRSFVVPCLLAVGAWLWADVGAAQTFQSQGPAPSFGPSVTVQSGDQPPNGTVSGAIQAIAISPTNSATMFVGATNGGIWTTRNGGSSWQPLTDNKISMSISSLAFDPTDANTQKLIAGVGATSNGRIGNANGGQPGDMYSNNGGADWADLAGSGGTLQNKNIISVAARGGNLLAAANDDIARGGGLYYSPNGGSTFSLVQVAGVRVGGRQQQHQRRRQRHPLLRLAERRRRAGRQRRLPGRPDQACRLGAGAVAGKPASPRCRPGRADRSSPRSTTARGSPTWGKLVGVPCRRIPARPGPR